MRHHSVFGVENEKGGVNRCPATVTTIQEACDWLPYGCTKIFKNQRAKGQPASQQWDLVFEVQT